MKYGERGDMTNTDWDDNTLPRIRVEGDALKKVLIVYDKGSLACGVEGQSCPAQRASAVYFDKIAERQDGLTFITNQIQYCAITGNLVERKGSWFFFWVSPPEEHAGGVDRKHVRLVKHVVR